MKVANVRFVEVWHVHAIHDRVLAVTGGAAGVLNADALASATMAPRATFGGQPLYPSLAQMAAAYAYGLARAHAFLDGNKRTALQVAAAFLGANRRPVRLGMDWVALMVRAASEDGFDRGELAERFALAMPEADAVFFDDEE